MPVHGGIALDMTAMTGLIDVDETSLTADVRAGIFGPDLEVALGAVGDGYTLGHWPQSMDLSTVGGWLACRGAGQYSTRYGKIEDMVLGLEVVLADGRVVHTEGTGPRGNRAESDAALRGQRGHTRRHHRGPSPRSPVAEGPGAARLGVHHVRGGTRGLPEDPPSRRDACGPPSLRPGRVGTQLRATRHEPAHRAR